MKNSSIQPIRSGKQQTCSVSHATSSNGDQGTCVTNLYTSVQLPQTYAILPYVNYTPT